jgi:dolichol-phosphate mannosyltransferase
MAVLVVLPTYNEAANIPVIMDRLLASPLIPDVLVVDDSSPDGTGQLVTELALRHPGRIRLLSRTTKDGLGAAYRAGFAAAVALGYDVIVQMDADGSHPVDALPAMHDALARGAGLVIGSRYVGGGEISADWPRRRRMLSRAGNAYARTLLRLPVRDATGGFKMWRAGLLASLDFGNADASGYAFQIQTTLAAVRRGATIREVAIRFVDRRLGESKMSHRIVAEALVAVLRMRLHGFPRPAAGTAKAARVPTAAAEVAAGHRPVGWVDPGRAA